MKSIVNERKMRVAVQEDQDSAIGLSFIVISFAVGLVGGIIWYMALN